MRRIRVNPESEYILPDYIEDCDRIVSAFLFIGIHMTRHEAHHLWRMYSDSVSAGWIDVPDARENGPKAMLDIRRMLADFYEVMED